MRGPVPAAGEEAAACPARLALAASLCVLRRRGLDEIRPNLGNWVFLEPRSLSKKHRSWLPEIWGGV